MGTSMKRGVHCVVWGSLASVLYAGPTNLERDVKAAATQPDANVAVAQSVVTVTRPNTAPAQPALQSAPGLAQPAAGLPQSVPESPEPTFKLAAVTPSETGVSSPPLSAPEPADECLL